LVMAVTYPMPTTRFKFGVEPRKNCSVAVIVRAPRDEAATCTAVASFNRHHFRQLSISIR
jgi:hypothetical protein